MQIKMVLTIISKHAALSRVIWSEVDNVRNPGTFFAKSTIFTMPADDNSVTFSHKNPDCPELSEDLSCKTTTPKMSVERSHVLSWLTSILSISPSKQASNLATNTWRCLVFHDRCGLPHTPCRHYTTVNCGFEHDSPTPDLPPLQASKAFQTKTSSGQRQGPPVQGRSGCHVRVLHRPTNLVLHTVVVCFVRAK